MIEFLYFAGLLFLFASLSLELEKHFFSVAFLVIMLGILFAFNHNNNDYLPYLKFYNNVSWERMTYITDNAESSPLFTLSMRLGKTFGLNFDGYRFFQFSSIFLSIYFLFRNKVKLEIFLLSYAVFPFWFDLVQLRFTWSALFVMYGIFFAVKEKKTISLIMLFLASFFHSMNLIFIFIPFISMSKAINPKTLRNFSLILIAFAVIFKTSVLKLMTNFMLTIGLIGEYQNYLIVSVKNGYLMYASYQIANVLLAHYLFNKCHNFENTSEWKKNVSLFNFNFQSIGILFIVLAMIDINFTRYFRIFYIMNAVTYASYRYNIINYKPQLIYRPLALLKNNIILKEYILFSGWVALWLFGQLYFGESLKKICGYVFGSFDG